MRKFFTGVFGVFSILMLFFTPSALLAQNVDPCPVARDLAKTAPPDMASVQSDIDILNLCVQRAQLLDQLIRLAGEDEAKTPVFGNNVGVGGTGSRTLFDLPSAARGGQAEQQAAPQQDAAPSQKQAAKPAAPKKPSWRIQSISGHSAVGMRARLVDSGGRQLTVTPEQKIDGDVVVKNISAEGVTVLFDGREHSLEWR